MIKALYAWQEFFSQVVAGAEIATPPDLSATAVARQVVRSDARIANELLGPQRG